MPGRIRETSQALRELDRRKSAILPSFFNDESDRPAAEKNAGRVIYVAGATKEGQISDGADWISLNATGGIGTAPKDATYLTLSNNSTLTAERALAVTSPITKADGGANSTLTLALNTAALGGTPALTLGTTNSEGGASTFVTTNSTIAAFNDGANPEANGSAAPGTDAVTARRDHVHPFSGASEYIKAFIATGDTLTVPTKNQIIVHEEYIIEGTGELALEGTAQLYEMGIAA